MVVERDPPVGYQHVAAWEAQGLSSTPTMEGSEEFEEAETAPSGADSGGATATAVGAFPNSTIVSTCLFVLITHVGLQSRDDAPPDAAAESVHSNCDSNDVVSVHV